MKILGIGVDIIENKRIKESIKNNKFKDRVYSSKELKLSTLSKNKVGFFSKSFVAKEAFAKALGTHYARSPIASLAQSHHRCLRKTNAALLQSGCRWRPVFGLTPLGPPAPDSDPRKARRAIL